MSGLPKDDDLDRIVEGAMMRNFGAAHAAAADSIEPSSGFAASVMERVRAEAGPAAALGSIKFPPIKFPWMRAIPGICMAVLAVMVSIALFFFGVAAVWHVISQALFAATTQGSSATLPIWAETVSRMHLGLAAAGPGDCLLAVDDLAEPGVARTSHVAMFRKMVLGSSPPLTADATRWCIPW